MSGNQPTEPDQPGPYGQQPPSGPGYQGPPLQGPQYPGGPQGPQYQGPQYQGPQYQGPQYQGPQYQGPQYPQPTGQQPTQPGAQGPSYSGPVYNPVPGPGQPGPGQPGPYGQPPQGPQQPYGSAGGPGGASQPKAGNAKIFIIVGAVVLALIVGAVVIGLATRQAPTTTGPVPGPTQSGPQDPGNSSAPPSTAPAADQAAAAKTYLEALASGKADAALALLDRQPADKTFLTDAVLAQSAKRAPLTEIDVSEPTSEYSSTVEATYKLGDTSVSTSIRVVKQGDGWKVREGYNELRLGSRRSKTLPMLINGVAVNNDTVRLFPGSYEFTTGDKNITYGDENVLVVESPSDYPTGLSDIEATLSAAGEKLYVAAVKSSLDACLKKKELAPSGCPNRARDGGNKIDKDTISWKLRNDPLTDIKVRLDYENRAVAEAYISLQFEVKATCNSGRSCSVRTYASGQPRVNMLAEPLKVVWSS